MKSYTADYVIVGAGTAGCVLANRLTEDPAIKVILVEAGERDRHPFIHVPAGFVRLLDHPTVTWRYRTEADAGTSGRAILFPRGRGLGSAGARTGFLGPMPDCVHLPIRDARCPGVGNVRLELERCPVEDGNAQDDELAQRRGNAGLFTHRREELLPAGGNRRAVEQHLIEDRDVATLAQDRALDLRKVIARAGLDKRDADRRFHRG